MAWTGKRQTLYHILLYVLYQNSITSLFLLKVLKILYLTYILTTFFNINVSFYEYK